MIARSAVLLIVLAGNGLGVDARAAVPADAWRGFLDDPSLHQPASRYPYAHCFARSARLYDIPRSLLVAVARGESAFDPVAKSTANAYGLMQIQWPGTARHLGVFSLRSLLNPCTNIDAGARYLSELIGRYQNDIERVLAAYNMGPGRVSASPQDEVPAIGREYARYIYRHLLAIGINGAGPDADPTPAVADRAPPGDSHYPLSYQLIEFATPVRARALADSLNRRHPELALHAQRVDVNRYAVSVRIADARSHAIARDALRPAGFDLP
jgi:hypothetical protein